MAKKMNIKKNLGLYIIMFLLMFVLIASSGYASPTNITCINDATPYIRDKIKWFCYFDTFEITHCISYVIYENSIIQTNPSRTFIEDYGVVDKFISENGMVNIYFTDTDLRDDRLVTFGVKCDNLTYEQNVTPQFKDPYVYIERTSWARENVAYILSGLIFVFVLGSILFWIIKNLLK